MAIYLSVQVSTKCLALQTFLYLRITGLKSDTNIRKKYLLYAAASRSEEHNHVSVFLSPLHRLFPPRSGITPPISISSPAIYDVQSWTIIWLDAFLDQTIKEPILVSHSPAGPQLFFL